MKDQKEFARKGGLARILKAEKGLLLYSQSTDGLSETITVTQLRKKTDVASHDAKTRQILFLR